MICDPRWANEHLFATPPATRLPSPMSLSEIDLAAGRAYLRSGDVEACFFQYELLAWAKPCFTLPGVAKKFLSSRMQKLFPDRGPDALCMFCMSVVPMGWSWAVFLVQTGQLNLLRGARPGADWLEDKRISRVLSSSGDSTPVKGIGSTRELDALYIDNYVSIASTAGAAHGAAKGMKQTFDAWHVDSALGPVDHDEFIGFNLHHGGRQLVPTKKKLVKASSSLLELWSSGHSYYGEDIEKVVGFIIHLFGIRCELFACFSAVYGFIDAAYSKRQPLWACVRQELRWCWALLSLATARMDRAWRSTVHTYDASPSGYGVVSANFSEDLVRAAGKQRERYRFRGIHASSQAPGDAAFNTSHFTSHAIEHARKTFVEVPAEMHGSPWRPVFVGKWRLSGYHQARREASARSWTVRHIASNGAWHGMKHLLLGGNLGLACAGDKGRSSRFEMLTQYRCTCAYALAADITFVDRWLPSEYNKADAASRISEPRFRVSTATVTAPTLEQGIISPPFRLKQQLHLYGLLSEAVPGYGEGADSLSKIVGASGICGQSPCEKADFKHDHVSHLGNSYGQHMHIFGSDGALASATASKATLKHKYSWFVSRFGHFGSSFPFGADTSSWSGASYWLGLKNNGTKDEGAASGRASEARATRSHTFDFKVSTAVGSAPLQATARQGAATDDAALSQVSSALPGTLRSTDTGGPGGYAVGRYALGVGGGKLRSWPALNGCRTLSLFAALGLTGDCRAGPHGLPVGSQCHSGVETPRARSLTTTNPLRSDNVSCIAPLSPGGCVAGIGGWLAFETYLRTGQVLRLAPFQIIAPLAEGAGALQHVTVMADAEEGGVPSKTREFNLSIPLDLPRHSKLAKIFLIHAQVRAGHDRLWGFNYQTLSNNFTLACRATGVHNLLLPCLHGLRHGGASYDRATKSRDLRAVQQRGGWRASASVRRYEKDGRLLVRLRKLPTEILQNAMRDTQTMLECSEGNLERRLQTAGKARAK